MPRWRGERLKTTGSVPSLIEVQRTVKDDIRLTGAGLHTGKTCEVVIRPAEANTGIAFISNGVRISGLIRSVTDTARGTTIGVDGERVMTIEHLMAGLRGCGIDNACVEVTGGEVPALDGSSAEFAAAIVTVGTEKQNEPRRRYTLSEPLLVKAKDSYILAMPAETFTLSYIMRYDHPMIGAQAVTFRFDEEVFQKEIAPARTFVLYEEVAQLVTQRLAQGGSLSNTIVIWQDHMSCDLRFPDELARHKALDIIGDLALVGGTLCADIVAVKSGHSLNVELARKITGI